ncbi:hypothetical protein IWW51_004656, partial [Coemansia sp. RSA 2702]
RPQRLQPRAVRRVGWPYPRVARAGVCCAGGRGDRRGALGASVDRRVHAAQRSTACRRPPALRACRQGRAAGWLRCGRGSVDLPRRHPAACVLARELRRGCRARLQCI